MNERLIEIYRSCRSKEALASQDQYNSANVLLGTEVEKFAESIVRSCALTAGLMEHEGRKGIGAQILDNFGVKE
jgi:hypothetical protein